MAYAVKVNRNEREIVIHIDSCREAERRGGAAAQAGPVRWETFRTLAEAEEYARKAQQSSTWSKKHCAYCLADD